MQIAPSPLATLGEVSDEIAYGVDRQLGLFQGAREDSNLHGP